MPEVTPEMINAGLCVLEEEFTPELTPTRARQIIRQIYMTMRELEDGRIRFTPFVPTVKRPDDVII